MLSEIQRANKKRRFLMTMGCNSIAQIADYYVKGRHCGSVAQLAECSHGKREALGSSPGRATIFSSPVTFIYLKRSTFTLHWSNVQYCPHIVRSQVHSARNKLVTFVRTTLS